MNAREKALANQHPTFSDLCDRIRTTRQAHLRAVAALEAAQDRVKVLSNEVARCVSDEDDASDALDEFIARETQVEE
jgi:hypothetical protein